MMNDNPAIGQWLKERRKTLDLTQEVLAERAGCSVSMIRKLEAGRARPSQQLAEILATVLALTPAERPGFVHWARGTTGSLVLTPPVPAPPARAAPGVPLAAGAAGGLPIPPTPFIGRAAEITHLGALLWRADVRLLTLTGPPGIGKTRLALEVAGSRQSDFRDGVCFVPLAAVRTPDAVAPALAGALGLRETAGRPLLPLVQDHLRGRHLLLVLDNFEQVSAAAPLVAALLAGAAGLKVLVTSRAALHVRGERTFPVPALGLPGGEALPPVADLHGYEAVRLFVERAQDVAPGFALTAANAAAVVGICRRLDGLPLALELAAARVQILSPAALLARLGAAPATPALDLLTGGAHDLLPHQQTLRATIAWSYDLLTPGEQTVFRRLAVFAGGCTLDAAEHVAGAPALPILDVMAVLVSKSLLRPAAVPDPDGEPRFGMLETIHEYAWERLMAAGEAAAAGAAHAAYFLTLAETAAPALAGEGAARWLARLEAEHANLRAALDWGRQTPGAAEIGLRLAGALGGFWARQGHWREGRAYLAQMLDMPDAAPRWRARALAAATRLAVNAGDFAAGQALGEAGLASSRALEDGPGTHQALFALARVAANTGAYPAARARLEESLVVGRALGDALLVSQSLSFLGDLAFFEGAYSEAAALYEEDLRLARQLGDPGRLAWRLHRRAGPAVEQGEYARAGPLIEEGLALCRARGLRGSLAPTLIWAGVLAAHQGAPGPARVYWQEALASIEALDDAEARPWVLCLLGWLTFRQGDPAAARAQLEAGLGAAQATGSRWSISWALGALGRVVAQEGDQARARRLLRESLGLARDLGARQHLATGLLGMAEIAAGMDAPARTATLFGAATALYARLGIRLGVDEQADLDRQVAALRARLELGAFAAAWAAGQELSVAEAVALALEDGAD